MFDCMQMAEATATLPYSCNDCNIKTLLKSCSKTVRSRLAKYVTVLGRTIIWAWCHLDTACAGNDTSHCLCAIRVNKSWKWGMVLRVAGEPIRISFFLALVMATLSLRQSRRRLPALHSALLRTKDSMMTSLSLPWHLSTVRTSICDQELFLHSLEISETCKQSGKLSSKLNRPQIATT